MTADFFNNEIILHGSVGASFWEEDSFTAAQVREQLAGMTGDIVVRINSGGGIAAEGQAIYTLLRDYPGKKHVVIDAVAASAASLIAMAGDTITVRRGAWLLVHDPAAPWLESRGTEADHLRAARQLAVMAGAYAAVYADRAGISREEARQIMRDETVMDGPMALQLGFATATDDTEALEIARFNYKIYAHAPEAARAASESLGERPGQLAILATIAGAARFSKQEPQMAKDESNLPTATGAERTRARRITEMTAAAGLPVSMATDLIADGLTLEDASDRIVAEWRKGGDVDKAMLGVGRDYTGGPDLRAKMTAGVEAIIDPRNATPIGKDAAQGGLGAIAMQWAHSKGLRPLDASQAVEMSMHSTSDFPLILDGAVANSVARRVAATLPPISRLSREIPREDYRAGRLLTLSATSMPQEVNEGGEIKFVTADEKGEALPTIRDFASGFNITNRALQNDSTATMVLSDISTRMAQGAIERLRAVLLEPLLANSGAGQNMADSQPFFRTQRGNLAATGAALSVATLSDARTAMRRQKGLRGENLSIEPYALLVPPELETAAEQLVATLMATKTADVNPFANGLEIVVEPGLVSTTSWYLVADPAQYDGLAHSFLDGQTSPRIESRPAWSTLGLEFRLTWAMDAKLVEPSGWFRNAGA